MPPAPPAVRRPRMARKQPPPDSPELHDKLKRLVEKRRGDLRHEDIARTIGLTPAAFSRILAGKQDTTVSRLLKILNAIDATLCDLDRA